MSVVFFSYYFLNEQNKKKIYKTYTVTFIYEGLSTQYSFEDMKLQQDKYPVFFERSGDKVIMDWASGNIGYAILGMAASPEEYPTAQSADGVIGKCLKLSTRSTGGMGAMMNMPMAAENLFIGTFDTMSALSDPLKATQFGLPFDLLKSEFWVYVLMFSNMIFK